MNRAHLAGAAVTAMVFIAGCEQTRPVPEYKPMLALQATQQAPQQAYRPVGPGPQPGMPAPRTGGG
jgi:hypothetical protein